MKSKINFLYCLLFMALSITLSAQKEHELAINFLANDNIVEVNIDQEQFISSLQQITEYLKKDLQQFPSSQKIGVLLILHKTGDPTFKLYSNPSIKKEEETKILTALTAFKMENTKLVDFPVFFSVNSKNQGEITDFKDFVNPVKQKITEYENADLQTKFKLNKEYAINDILPVLAAYETIVDKQFQGVKNLGNLVASTNFNATQNIADLTDKNKDYWRATLEMSAGNQLIPITKIFMLASQGEFDYAKQHMDMVRVFSQPKSVSDNYLKELTYRLSVFEQDLNKQINTGIGEHDKGNYSKAISIYDQILSMYPNSSWALYEKYFSENALNLKEQKITASDRSDWDKAKIQVYKHNPLYNMDVRASNGKEMYLLFRRQEISQLFKNKAEKMNDLFKYAEIAVDLGAYDFAAQLFWISATYDKEHSQKSTHYFLYCLDKLGEKDLKSNFKGDFDSIFKKIDKERQKAMEDNVMYKAMKN